MRIYDIIEKKRSKQKLSKEEIDFFVKSYVKQEIPDYQASALLMAICINEMDPEETTNLTLAMANSGDVLDLSQISGTKVDKHSTGGVGDKTTLIVGPIVAACKHPVAKMSGRGLGHTGGTIDKMESIVGLETEIDKDKFIKQVNDIGISVIGQSGNICPADKKIYALRDVTATVESIPLIASSVMSKKIAAGADKILLDVKIGKGAFMKNLEAGKELASLMVDIGSLAGRETVAILSNMDAPLGHATGNTLEILEVIEILNNRGPSDLKDIVIELASQMLILAGEGDKNTCQTKVKEVLENGLAYEKLKEMIIYQKGKINEGNIEFRSSNSKQYPIYAKESGFISEIDAEAIGFAALELGAGREVKEDVIDYGAGVYLEKSIGDKVTKGDQIGILYTDSKQKLDKGMIRLENGIKYSKNKPKEVQHIFGIVTKSGVEEF